MYNILYTHRLIFLFVKILGLSSADLFYREEFRKNNTTIELTKIKLID